VSGGSYLRRPDDGLGHYQDCGHACPCYKAGVDHGRSPVANEWGECNIFHTPTGTMVYVHRYPPGAQLGARCQCGDSTLKEEIA
jgi:hypothetical protein